MIKFNCKCGKKYEVPEKYAGKKVRCKKCDNMVRIPQISPTENSVSKPEPANLKSNSNLKLWIAVIFVVVLFISSVAGLLIYSSSQEQKEKELFSKCEMLFKESESLASEKSWKDALQKSLYIKKLSQNRKISLSSFIRLLKDTDIQIKDLESKIFAKQHLPILNKMKKEADGLFMKTKFAYASNKYYQVVQYINKFEKEKDADFNSIYTFCKKRIAVSGKLSIAAKINENLGSKSRILVNEQYKDLLSCVDSLRRPSNEMKEFIDNLHESEKEANTYYDNIEKQKEVARMGAEQEKKNKNERSKILVQFKDDIEKLTTIFPDKTNLALEQFLVDAHNGDSEKQFALCDLYLKINSQTKAIEWLTKAALNGYSDAMCFLGEMYFYGRYVKKDIKKAYDLFKQAAMKGNANAQFFLASIYEFGAIDANIKPNSSLALKWYLEASEHGVLEAMLSASKIYKDGKGVPVDIEKANHYRVMAETKKETVTNIKNRFEVLFNQIHGNLSEAQEITINNSGDKKLLLKEKYSEFISTKEAFDGIKIQLLKEDPCLYAFETIIREEIENLDSQINKMKSDMVDFSKTMESHMVETNNGFALERGQKIGVYTNKFSKMKDSLDTANVTQENKRFIFNSRSKLIDSDAFKIDSFEKYVETRHLKAIDNKNNFLEKNKELNKIKARDKSLTLTSNNILEWASIFSTWMSTKSSLNDTQFIRTKNPSMLFRNTSKFGNITTTKRNYGSDIYSIVTVEEGAFNINDTAVVIDKDGHAEVVVHVCLFVVATIFHNDNLDLHKDSGTQIHAVLHIPAPYYEAHYLCNMIRLSKSLDLKWFIHSTNEIRRQENMETYIFTGLVYWLDYGNGGFYTSEANGLFSKEGN